VSDRFEFQKDRVRRALADLDGPVLNVGCCDDQACWPSNALKPLDPERVINCDISAVDELYEDPDDDTKVTGTRPTAAEVLFDAARDRWPFEDGSAALVVLGDILEHLSPQEILSTLMSARRVSRRVCITVPEDTRPTNTPERADRFRKGHVHRTIVTEPLLRRALKQAGWRIVRFTLVPDYDNSSQYWGQQVMGYYVEAE
jgi:hypothetical protein